MSKTITIKAEVAAVGDLPGGAGKALSLQATLDGNGSWTPDGTGQPALTFAVNVATDAVVELQAGDPVTVTIEIG